MPVKKRGKGGLFNHHIGSTLMKVAGRGEERERVREI
jgi:hypothetical protein